MSLEAATDQLLSDAALQADRLARRHNLQPADRDDAFQEIALDAWRRLPGYRSCRGDIEPFLGVVTLNQARKIDARLRGWRRKPEISLDAPIASRGDDGAPLTLAECLTESDGLPALLGNQIDGHGRPRPS